MLSGQHEAIIALIGTLTTVEQVSSAMDFARMLDEDEDSRDDVWQACQQAMTRVKTKPQNK